MANNLGQQRGISVRRLRAASVVLIFSLVLGGSAIQAQTYTVLHRFTGPDGASPRGRLIRDTAGNLYGTTPGGGTGTQCSGFPCGTVFKLDPTGKETVLYNFTNGADGANPAGGLFRDPAGNLYGTTTHGGDPTCQCGTVFRLNTTGTLDVLHAFKGGTDGINANGTLVSINGELYGSARSSGAGGCPGDGCGLIFKVTKSGVETVLYRFTGGADGSSPGDLVRDAAGNLYGAAAFNGNGSGCQGAPCGTVFKLDAARQLTVLYTFGGVDGGTPMGRLIRDVNGKIHGTTLFGGDFTCGGNGGCGVIFRLDASGNEKVIHTFFGHAPGGWEPFAGLLDSAGTLYGTTSSGGFFKGRCSSFGCGVVYRVDNMGHYSVLYRFTGEADGAFPYGELIQDSAGNLYGTASSGGTGCSNSGGCGVVFRITP